jgi:hypothetical protein
MEWRERERKKESRGGGGAQQGTAYETARKDALNLKFYDLDHIIKGTTFFCSCQKFNDGESTVHSEYECPTTADRGQLKGSCCNQCINKTASRDHQV